MALLGIDVAWDRPTVAAIKATGAHWVARYFSPDASKNLKAAEVVSYPAAGLSIVTVYESTAARATAGFAAGKADAQLAEQQRKSVGLGADHVHYFAVDTDTSWASVWPYFQGVLSVLPQSRVGVYGGLRVIQGAHGQGFRFLWQTVAWSGGVWAPFAVIRQTGGELLGGAADVDYADAADFGQSPRPITPKPVPVPQEDDMPFTAQQLHDIVKQACTEAVVSQPARDAVAFAELWWLQHALAGTVPSGASQGQTQLITEIHGLVVKLSQMPTPK